MKQSQRKEFCESKIPNLIKIEIGERISSYPEQEGRHLVGTNYGIIVLIVYYLLSFMNTLTQITSFHCIQYHHIKRIDSEDVAMIKHQAKYPEKTRTTNAHDIVCTSPFMRDHGVRIYQGPIGLRQMWPRSINRKSRPGLDQVVNKELFYT